MDSLAKLNLIHCPFCGKKIFTNVHCKIFCSEICKNQMDENVKYKRFGTITLPSKMNFPNAEKEIGDLIKKLL